MPGLPFSFDDFIANPTLGFKVLDDLHAQGSEGIEIPARVGSGAGDMTSMIADIIAKAPAQSTIKFRDPGPVKCQPLPTITKALRIVGAGGRYGTRLVPSVDTTSPILSWDIPAGGATIFDTYGPSIERLGIDLTAAPNAVGVRTSKTTQWVDFSRMVILGGKQSIDHHGPNGYMSMMFLADCSDAMINIDQFGLGLHLSHIYMANNVSATCNAYLKCAMTYTGATPLGDIHMNDVLGVANSAGGKVMTNGMVFSNGTNVDMQIFADGVVIDNVIGGAGLVLTNIRQVNWDNGWINSAGTDATNIGGPSVAITGGGQLTFRGNRYFSGGSPLSTYKFISGATQYFISTGNVCSTGPAYYLPATGRPTDMLVDDLLPGVTDITQVTNDIDAFHTAATRRWGPLVVGGILDRRETGTTPPCGYATLVGGQAIIANVAIRANTRVRVTRERPGGTPGHLYSRVPDNNPGVDFIIKSTDVLDTSSVYWEMYDSI